MRTTKLAAYLALTLGGAAIAGGPALAASQGQLGPNSNGSVNITLNLPDLVRISDLDDISINFSGPSDIGTDDVCVFSNTGNYSITATTVENSYQLTAGPPNTDTVTYSVEWATSSGQITGTPLLYNTALTNRSTSGANPACSGGLNATLIIRVSDTDVGTAINDTYSGTLLLSVAPF
jgi:hypothetical protein